MGKNNGGGLAGHSGSDEVWRGRRLADGRGSAAGRVGSGAGPGLVLFHGGPWRVVDSGGGFGGTAESRPAGRGVGPTRIALAVTEARYGWKKALTRTKAERQDGGFLLHGTKLFVQDAGDADLLVCTAALEDGEVAYSWWMPRCPACPFGPLADS